MNADELVKKVQGALKTCAGYEADAYTTDRELALNYYFMRPNGTEVPGRPRSIAGDVSAFVEANLAAMLEAFKTENLVEFAPLSSQDVEQAQLESDACVHYVMGVANGRHHLAQAIKDTLLLRNGWTKTWCDIEERARTRELEHVSPDALPELMAGAPGLVRDVLEYDPEAETAKVREIQTIKRFRSEAVPVENMLYPKEYSGCDYAALQRIPFIAERHVEARGELIRRGFSKAKVEALKELRSDIKTDANARNPKRSQAEQATVDTSTDLVEWFECYVLIEGTQGAAFERRRVSIGGNELLENEPHALVPYATGQAILAPHRLTGISLWDKLHQRQDTNSALERALLMNVEATSRNRVAYKDGKVNVEDVGDGRVNGEIRVKATEARVSDALMAFAVPDTSVGVQAAIAHQRAQRTELGGAALDMASGEMQLQKQVGSMGLDRAYSVAEQLAGHMTENIAYTLVRSTFLVAHATLREHFEEPIEIQRGGAYASTIPAEWQGRERLTVKVGMSAGERQRRSQALDRLITAQIGLADKGMEGVLVDVQGFYALLMDWARVADVPNPERYFIDPRTEGAQMALKSKDQEAARMREMQEELVRQAVTLEKMGKALDKYKHDSELQYKYWAERQENIRTEAEIAGEATVELLKAEDDANGDQAPKPGNGKDVARREPGRAQA